jgi:hypothetical protein
MNYAKSILAAAALALACGAAFAAPGFNDMDKNADGQLTRDEAAGNKELLAKWNEADKNKDGVLTRGEYLTVMIAKDWNTVKEKVAGKPSTDSSSASTGSTGASTGSTSASTGSTSATTGSASQRP